MHLVGNDYNTEKSQYMTTDRCKLTANKVVATSSPLYIYKLTFFPTDRQTNLPQTRIITVLEEHA